MMICVHEQSRTWITGKLKNKRSTSIVCSKAFSWSVLSCRLCTCIAKNINQYDFPNKKLAEDSYSHDLIKLIGVAGLKTHLTTEESSNQTFKLNWAVAKDWSEQTRYETNITQAEAKDLIDAIADNNTGVLQ